VGTAATSGGTVAAPAATGRPEEVTVADSTAPMPVEASLVREGEYWSVLFNGRSPSSGTARGCVTWTTCCGTRGQEFQALALVAAVEGPAAGSLARREPGLTRRIPAAGRRPSTRRRSGRTSPGRDRRARRAVGRRTRARRPGRDAPGRWNARLAVTKAIRGAMRKLAGADAPAGPAPGPNHPY
jgi:hypothetical protein